MNPIGHLSHKEFNQLTDRELQEVAYQYNEWHKYPEHHKPTKNELELFWEQWNY